MVHEKRIVGISGSLRKGSLNTAMLRAASELMPSGSVLDILSLSGIPLFNSDLEKEGTPDSVAELRKQIGDSDGLLIATPEYNYSIPGVLKNGLDWASRPPRRSAMVRKPIAIMGAGGMMGTVRAQMHLRQMLLHDDSRVMSKPELFVSRAFDKFDASGRLVDEPTLQQLQKLLSAFMTWIERWQEVNQTTVPNH
jgi:chromate reductase